ncbi:TetR family transcriptional regulator [Haloactinopolyspora alba]|uniref:TetR family transcriptional regulator n=1 Tax=Haloactinopolyspora alba TaxID=648780 RepID=A0A2P8EB29_9ACTN|nr:TetR/AcrR family transcriptional regulator [Haloactinopolyspora alba]PSL06647.1 TetR family transcriptional regulator [Haloactinopolyspora alba]
MPRTATTGLTPAGERILAAAGELFYAQGIRAVGVEMISEVAGTTKKTLYDRFGSKDALVALYLQRRAERWRAFVHEHLERHAPEPGRYRVLAVLDALSAWNVDATRGCAFVNAYAEIGGTDHPGLAVVRAEKSWTRSLYVRLLEEAGLDADRAAELGLRMTLLHEGALILMTAGEVADAIGHARAAAAEALDLAFGDEPAAHESAAHGHEVTTAPRAAADAEPADAEPADGAGRPTPADPTHAAVADLAGRLGVDAAAITVAAVQEVTWRDSSLGCPKPGMAYQQMLVDGHRIVLEHAGHRYEYHAGGRRGPFLCDDPQPPASVTTSRGAALR